MRRRTARSCNGALRFSRIVNASFMRCARYLLIILLMTAAFPASGQAAYSLSGATPPVEVAPQVRDVDGVPYAAIGPFVEAAGGGQRIAGGTAQVDLRGATAWIDAGRTRVSGSRTNVALQHPAQIQDGFVWIAVADLVTFFDDCFGVRWAPVSMSAEEDDLPAASPEEMDAAALEQLAVPFEPASAEAEEVAEPADANTGTFRVLIDPGHGGVDKGVVGSSGMFEAEAVLLVSTALAESLAETGNVETILTRTDNRAVSIGERSRIATDGNVGLILSIHSGAALTPTVSGTSVLYGTNPDGSEDPEARAAAATIAKAIADSTGRETRAVRGMPMRLRGPAHAPSILVEVACLNNPAEERILSDEDFRSRVAAGLADGIKRVAAQGGSNR